MSHPHYCLVLGELQMIITSMRRNRKWKTGPLDYSSVKRYQNPLYLVVAFDRLRQRLLVTDSNTSTTADILIDPATLIKPFVTVISSPETSGHLTALAIAAIQRFVFASSPSLFNTTTSAATQSSAAAIHAIVLSLSHCRFESTDPSKDELVLFQLLSMVDSLLSCPSSVLLDDVDIWSMMKTCYRIYRYMRPPDYSELLCHQAEQTILQIVRTVCKRLNDVDVKHTPHSTVPSISTSTSSQSSSSSSADNKSSTFTSSSPTPSYGYVSVLKLFEFISTLAEISHADVGFAYSLSQGLPVPPYFNGNNTVPTSSIAQATSMPLSPSPSPSPSPNASDGSSISSHQSYFPSRRILLPSADLLDLGLLTLPPPPLSLPPTHFSSPTALSKALADWSRRTIFTTQLLHAAFESSLYSVVHYPVLINLIEDGVCKFLLRNCRSQHAMLYSVTLRTFYLLMKICREKLSMQMEVMFNTVYLRMLVNKGSTLRSEILSASSSSLSSLSSAAAAHSSHQHHHQTTVSLVDPSSTSYDLKELTLESLLDFCRLPYFFSELYINYDCSPTASNLFENLFRSLCKSVFPVQGLITGNHVLAMKCLIEGIRWMKDRATANGLSDSHHATNTYSLSPSRSPSSDMLHIIASSLPPSSLSSLNPYICLLSDLRATRLYKRQLQLCVDEFNKKPKKGIAAMTHTLGLFPSFERLKQTMVKKEDIEKLIPTELEEIVLMARFLRTTPGLDKVIIGQYIAEPGPLAACILKEYVSLFDFHHQSLDDALRMFLESFRLPLEAQQIDRVMQAFAIQYHSQNPNLLHNADVVHTLSFSLIMLNTDAHNELIRNKMTLEQFINNNRGINAGENVPRALLEGLYHTIKKKEIKMSGDGLTGEVNDALWTDLLMMTTKAIQQRPFMRFDRLTQTIDSYMIKEQPSQPSQPSQQQQQPSSSSLSPAIAQGQTVNGHIIGMTIFRPPMNTAVALTPSPIRERTTSSGSHHHTFLPSTPVSATFAFKADHILNNGLHPISDSPNINLSRHISGSATHADHPTTPSPAVSSSSSASSIYTVTRPSPNISSLNLDEDMFLEGWNAAIAALSMVLDLLQVDSEGHSIIERQTGATGELNEEDDGWDKVQEGDSQQQTNDSNAQHHGIEHQHVIEAEGGDNDNHLLNHLKEGFSLLASIAASFSKPVIVDKVISALCKFTGLLSDYLSDSSISSSSTISSSSPIRSAASQHRLNTNTSLLRFSAHPKSQWSLSLMFSIVHQHQDHIRLGWKEVIICILQLYGIGLLPASLLLLDDHIGWLEDKDKGERLKGRSQLLSFAASLSLSTIDDEEKPLLNTVSGLFSSVSSYLYGMSGASPSSVSMGEQEKDRSRSPEVEAAGKKCLDCLAQCDIPSLFSETKMMHSEAVKALLAALIDTIPLKPLAQMQWNPTAKKGNKAADSRIPKDHGEGRVLAGQWEGSGLSLHIPDEDPDMITTDIYAATVTATNDKQTGDNVSDPASHTIFPSSPSSNDCSSCVDIPVEIRRLLLCHQLLIEVMLFNRDRMEQFWKLSSNHLLTIMQSTQTSNGNSASMFAASPPAFVRSSSIPTISSRSTVAFTANGLLSPSATPLSPTQPVSAPVHIAASPQLESHSRRSSIYSQTPISSVPSTSVVPLTLPHPLPTLVIESAVVALISLSSRLLHKEMMSTVDLFSLLSSFTTVNMSHVGPSSQLMAGLFSMLQVHATVMTQTPQISPLLHLLISASNYHHTFMLGYQCLVQILLAAITLIKSDSASAPTGINLSSYSLSVAAVQHYAQSRWCSPAIGTQCCSMLYQLYEIGIYLISHYNDEDADNTIHSLTAHSDSTEIHISPSHPSANGDAFKTPRRSSRIDDISMISSSHTVLPSMPSVSSPVTSITSTNTSTGSFSPTSPLFHLLYLWEHICLQLFSAYRAMIISCSSRIRLLHAAHITATRPGGSGIGVQRKPIPSSNDDEAISTQPSYRGFIGYVQAFGRIRRQCIEMIKHILIGESTSLIIGQAASQAAIQNLQPDEEQSHDESFLSLSSTLFWQLCLDSLVFPILFHLSTSYPIDLELTESLTIARAQAVSILEKIFLLHLPQLLAIESKEATGQQQQLQQHQSANSIPHLGLGFCTRWFQVLKILDVLLQLGLRRERLIAERKKTSVYDEKRQPRKRSSDADSNNNNSNNNHNRNTIMMDKDSDARDALESGVLLSESVEEALKNLILMMKTTRVFVEGSHHDELWELTWAIIDPVFPIMKQQLFPEIIITSQTTTVVAGNHRTTNPPIAMPSTSPNHSPIISASADSISAPAISIQSAAPLEQQAAAS